MIPEQSASLRFISCLAVVSIASASLATAAAAQPVASSSKPASQAILSEQDWQRLYLASARGLNYLAAHQAADGSIHTHPQGQPGITALATMAMLAHGHVPGAGPYGKTIDRAIEFILSCQHENGLIALSVRPGPLVRRPMDHAVGTSGAYNHAIASLALSEVYGMTGGAEPRLRPAIEKALEASITMQRWPKSNPGEKGGWRYLHPFNNIDADLSIVGWELKFLRSAKNAGFDPPEEAIDEAVGYVLRSFNPALGSFEYKLGPADRRTRAMAGVGILALAHSSRHSRREAAAAADFILQNGFTQYNRTASFGNYRYQSDRYHYGVFYCSLAMYQMGGRHWEQFFPPTVRTLLANQNRDGSWEAESAHDTQFGQCYTTSLVLLALSAPNQLLPIYQR